MKKAILAALLLLAACGKVSEPLPPIIRIPQKVENLSAVQSGYTVVLTWTNPSKYIDGNPAADLGLVHVFRDNVEIGMPAATAAGQAQSFPVDVMNRVGFQLTFTIQLVVPKANKPSPISNTASIRPVDVPGSPRNPKFIVDKDRIAFTWEPPELHPELVEAYVVQRSDRPVPSVVHALHLEDEFEPGKTYMYTVTAVRGTNPQISGEGKLTPEVIAIDNTPPLTPSGLATQSLGSAFVLVTWMDNSEPDLKGYKLFRSDRPDPIYTGRPNGFRDPDYVPGKGLSYQVLAEDRYGNPSVRSAPQPGP